MVCNQDYLSVIVVICKDTWSYSVGFDKYRSTSSRHTLRNETL